MIDDRHPNNETAKDSIKAFGRILADRYNPVVGCTRSWDTSDPTDFQVSTKLPILPIAPDELSRLSLTT